MKALIILAAIVAAECIEHYKLDAESLQQEWGKYKEKHNLTYNDVEEKFRFTTFVKNIELIEHHNREYDAGMHSYTLGVNQFAHVPQDEFQNLGGFKQDNQLLNHPLVSTYEAPVGEILPKSWDWRKKGAVSPVRNQGNCRCDYNIASVESIEGAHQIKTGKMIALSEQQILDCSYILNLGCEGGLTATVFMYILNSDGLNSQESYPYVGHQQDHCKFDNNSIIATLKNYKGVYFEKALASAVVNNCPITITLNTDPKFKFYKSGVYSNPACGQDFGGYVSALLVGYGTEDSKDYWLIKNSWGLGWGEDGYIKLLSGKNLCGIGYGYNIIPILK